MDDVRAATEETLLDLADHLPREAAEALLNLATGTKLPIGPPPAMRIADASPPTIEEAFQHPDVQSRFRVIESREELERALDAPWDRFPPPDAVPSGRAIAAGGSGSPIRLVRQQPALYAEFSEFSRIT